MKLAKAIEILELLLKQGHSALHPDTLDALELSIGAMVRIRYQRKKPTVPHNTLLPGETPED